jgi:hypothetical protein
MKNYLVLLLVLSTLVLGAVSLHQWRKLAEQRTEAIAGGEQSEQKDQQIRELQLANEISAEQQRLLTQQIQRLTDSAAKAPAAESFHPDESAQKTTAAKPPQEPGGFGKLLTQLMDDPDTKKLIREQQRIMVDQLYGPLMKRMGLTAKEAELFKDMLSDQMMKGTERASALFGGTELDRKQLIDKLAAEQKKSELEIQEFLGDGLYAQYKEYQQTVGERAQLNMFRQQTSGSEHPLTESQAEQILQFMSQEKANVAAATGQSFPTMDQSADQLEAMLSEDRAEAMLRAQESANKQVFERARAILSPAQLDDFAKFQDNQLQMTRMGMSMARKFMGGGQESGSEPVP